MAFGLWTCDAIIKGGNHFALMLCSLNGMGIRMKESE